MFLTGLVLWRSDHSKRAELRSVASDLFLENEGEGPARPVTVCHITMQASRTKHPLREAGNEADRSGQGAESARANAEMRNPDPSRRCLGPLSFASFAPSREQCLLNSLQCNTQGQVASLTLVGVAGFAFGVG